MSSENLFLFLLTMIYLNLQTLVHYSLHLLFPGVIAWTFFREQWKGVWLIMLLTMLVDLDHLLATPVFDPGRCSIGFHPLHSYSAIAVYCMMCFHPKTRIVGLGLTFHMITDGIDCIWINFY